MCNTLLLFYEDSFVRDEFSKHDIESKISNSTFIDFEIRQYIVSSTDELNTSILNEKEKTHLKDVRRLVDILKIFTALLIFVMIVLAFEVSEKKIKWRLIFRNVAIYSSVFILVLILIRFFFYEIFIGFHKIAFTNELWKMSSEDTLTKLYPRIFFMTAIVTIIIRTMIICYGISGIIYGKKIIEKFFSKTFK